MCSVLQGLTVENSAKKSLKGFFKVRSGYIVRVLCFGLYIKPRNPESPTLELHFPSLALSLAHAPTSGELNVVLYDFFLYSL